MLRRTFSTSYRLEKRQLIHNIFKSNDLTVLTFRISNLVLKMLTSDTELVFVKE